MVERNNQDCCNAILNAKLQLYKGLLGCFVVSIMVKISVSLLSWRTPAAVEYRYVCQPREEQPDVRTLFSDL